MMLKTYQICVAKSDLSDNKNGQMISSKSRVVILEIQGSKALVCRYGNYLDNLWTQLNLLTAAGK